MSIQIEDFHYTIMRYRDILQSLRHIDLPTGTPQIVPFKARSQIKQRRDRFMRAHVLIRNTSRALIHTARSILGFPLTGRCLLIRNLFPEFDNLPLHLGIATPLPNPLEIGLDLALELQSSTSSAYCEGLLNDIASKL